jgi:hypothetical protein
MILTSVPAWSVILKPVTEWCARYGCATVAHSGSAFLHLLDRYQECSRASLRPAECRVAGPANQIGRSKQAAVMAFQELSDGHLCHPPVSGNFICVIANPSYHVIVDDFSVDSPKEVQRSSESNGNPPNTSLGRTSEVLLLGSVVLSFVQSCWKAL